MAESSFSGPGPVPMARSVVTPAARARSSMASRSSANCGKSICACESMSSIRSTGLLQARADFDVFVGETGEDWTAFGADGGGYDHAVGFHAAKFAWREIDDYGNLAADEFFRLVVLRDARANLANLRADIHREFEQLVCADNALRRFDLADAQLDFRKILDAAFLRRAWRRRSRSRRSCARRRFRRRCGRCGIQFFVCHRFDPFYRLIFFHAREQRLRLDRKSTRLN